MMKGLFRISTLLPAVIVSGGVGNDGSQQQQQQQQQAPPAGGHDDRPSSRQIQGTALDGEPCDTDLDCAMFACGRETATVDSPKVCCFSGDYIFISASLQAVCTWQEEGAECLNNRDDLCLSNVCVKGTCLAEPVANGETCDSNADCFNFKCGRVTASISETDMICCPSDTHYSVAFLGNICGEQEDGKPCAGVDEMCASGTCVNGFCGAPGGDTTGPTECIKNTDQILLSELDADSSELRTYVLCSDTTFPIGNFNFDTFDYENGMAALELFKSNIHILCGEDGAVGNNCIFEGGTSHAEIFFSQDGDPVLNNVLLSGITFKGAEDYNAAFFARGEVTFRDCKFMENENTAILDIIGNNYEGELTVHIDGCVFEKNTVSFFDEEDEATALVYLGGQKLVITDSLFQDNTLIVPEGSIVPDDWMTIMILVFGDSEITVEGSCFMGNDIFAAIYGDNAFVNKIDGPSNYASGFSDCNGLTDFNSIPAECLAFGLDTCPIEGAVVPPPTVAPPPTNEPPGTPSPTPESTPDSSLTDAPAGGDTSSDSCTRSLCPEGEELENPDFVVKTNADGSETTCGATDAILGALALDGDGDTICGMTKSVALDAGCTCKEGSATPPPTPGTSTQSTPSSGPSRLDDRLVWLSGFFASTLAMGAFLL